MGDPTLKIVIMIALALVQLFFAVNGVAISPEDTFRMVSASEILTKIYNGDPVEYDHIEIKGNLILKAQSSPNVIGSSIEITNSKIIGEFNFENSIFRKKINFSDSLFSGSHISFENSSFRKSVSFNGAELCGFANFKYSIFENAASFDKAKFNYIADFSESNFMGNANFNGSEFSDLVSFWKTYFNAPAFFTYSEFNGDPEYLVHRWGGIADFNYARFNQPVYFYESTWNGSASFIDTQFNHYIRGWKYIKDSFNSDEVTHLALVKNLKDHGQYDEADDCYFSYRYHDISSIFDFLGLISCGFGVRPMYTVYSSLIVIVLFGFAYWKGNGIYKLGDHQQKSTSDRGRYWSLSSIVDYQLSKIKKFIYRLRYLSNKVIIEIINMKSIFNFPGQLMYKTFYANISLRDALYFSALVFFTLHPPHDWEYSKNWRYIILLEDVLGGIFITLFIVTLSNIMIRY